jgi:poly(3-hydroxybutyrate) depolymerase
MWWKPYLPDFFDIVIRAFLFNRYININKVFITGYSAGGDGIYNLAPMIADSLAGAAMMAGHPNAVELYNIRNLCFSIQVGGQDSAYSRNS